MTQFQEGQDVEVKTYKWSPLYVNSGRDVWTTYRKAKIIGPSKNTSKCWIVMFENGDDDIVSEDLIKT
jgi:hypothetical protein